MRLFVVWDLIIREEAIKMICKVIVTKEDGILNKLQKYYISFKLKLYIYFSIETAIKITFVLFAAFYIM